MASHFGRPGLRLAAERYGVAVACVATATILSLVAQALTRNEGPHTSYVLFAAAVVVSANLRGFWSGAAATLLAIAATSYLHFHPIYSFQIDDVSDRLLVVLFLLEGLFLSLITAAAAGGRLAPARTRVARYGLALASVAGVTAVKLPLALYLEREAPFMLFYAAVLYSAWGGGRGPGLAATGASALTASYLFCIPMFSFRVSDPDRAAELLLFAAEGCVLSVLGATMHLARLRAEARRRELREAEERIRLQALLLDQAREAIVILDLAGRVCYWSRGAERLYGRGAAEALGVPVEDLLGRAGIGLALESVYRAVDEAGEWYGELARRTAAGQEQVVLTRWTPLRDDAGKPFGRLILGTDVTEKKRLEQQLLRAQRLESLGTLASGVAHDLNNVLTPILMGAEMLKYPLDAGQRDSLLDTILASAERGAGLLRQILLFARGSGGEAVPVPFGPIVREVQRLLEHTLAKNIELSCEVPKDLWPALGGTTQLSQVLMNLCVNARDAMPSGGRLLIHAANLNLAAGDRRLAPKANPGPYVVLTVADTGTGIPPELLEKIFDPFFTTKDPDKGTGLGLATTQSILARLGGFLDIVSEVGKGTCFTLYFPAAPVQSAPGRAAAAESPQGAGELVLVVDDEASIREIARGTLEAYGYRVVTARDGQEALALLAEHGASVRVILIDMRMPGLDGLATLRAVRQVAPQLPAILCSGLPADGARDAAFLLKPYSAAQLLQTVRDVLAPAPPQGVPEPHP